MLKNLLIEIHRPVLKHINDYIYQNFFTLNAKFIHKSISKIIRVYPQLVIAATAKIISNVQVCLYHGYFYKQLLISEANFLKFNDTVFGQLMICVTS